MEENKNKGNNIIVHVIEILVALALGVLGATYLNQFFGDEVVEEKTKCDVPDNATNIVSKVEDFPKSSDKGLNTYSLMDEFNKKQSSLVFDSVTVPIEGINFDFACSSHDMDGETIEECTMIDVLVNGYLITYLNIGYEATDVIITDDYIITQQGLGDGYWGDIAIYEHNGIKLKSIGQTEKSYYNKDNKLVNTNMRVVDNKLYYIASKSSDDYSCESNHKIMYKYIDLKNNLDEQTIQTFEANTCDLS